MLPKIKKSDSTESQKLNKITFKLPIMTEAPKQAIPILKKFIKWPSELAIYPNPK